MNTKIDTATRNLVIDNLVKGLKDNYIFPDIANKIAGSLQTCSFENITCGVELANALASKLRQVGKDRHLDVQYNPDFMSESEPSDDSNLEEMLKYQVAENSGVAKVEILDNIGILKLDSFFAISDTSNTQGAKMAKEAIDAAMAKLSEAEILVIDLRENNGGDPATIAYLLSHILSPDTHVNSIIWRRASPERPNAVLNNKVGGYEQQFRTQYLGKQSPTNLKSIFVLTSCNTFSAGEELAYDLQALGRATVIGEVTGGGANPGEVISLGPHFSAFISTGRALNPITGTNWDGVGIEPDVVVPADQALAVALQKAGRQ